MDDFIVCRICMFIETIIIVGKHKLIGAKVDILRILFGVLFGIFLEYSKE
jgi:uncharacterized membrane protein YczE